MKLHFATLVCLVPSLCPAQSWWTAYQQRASRYATGQPRWASPVFMTSVLLNQRVREDFTRSISSTGVTTWNLGTGKGLQLVAVPHMEIDVLPPPFLKHSDRTADGFGDFALGGKLRLVSATQERGNYVVTAVLNTSIPTGSYRNGSQATVVQPTLAGGKGWGSLDVIASLGSALPVSHVETIGRSISGNAAAQYRLREYLTAELEVLNTTYVGGSRDGQTQSLLAPGFILGRLPYTLHQQDRRLGYSIGVGFQSAVTHTHATNHTLTVSTRVHF